MNKLPLANRIQILAMLCEGSSMRSISRVADVSINTVSKLFVDAEGLRGVPRTKRAATSVTCGYLYRDERLTSSM